MAPTELQLSGEVHVAPEADLLYDDLAAAVLSSAFDAVARRGVFHVALSGGKTPEPFFIRLVTDPRFRHLPWQHTHLWLVDERRVPHHDDRSNWKLIRETLADHVPMRRRQLHPMPVEDDAAERYERELRRVFAEPAYAAPPSAPGPAGGGGADAQGAPVPTAPAVGGGPVTAPRLDYVLLGMGDDAHTASLFPGSPALASHDRLVALNDGPGVTPPPRVTMTFALLNAARQVAVLVTGEKKLATLRRIDAQLRAGGPDPLKMPITGIAPREGSLTWYLDAPAAGVDPAGPIDLV